jgi:hypothetical protein
MKIGYRRVSQEHVLAAVEGYLKAMSILDDNSVVKWVSIMGVSKPPATFVIEFVVNEKEDTTDVA